jgi:hypothetical protein
VQMRTEVQGFGRPQNRTNSKSAIRAHLLTAGRGWNGDAPIRATQHKIDSMLRSRNIHQNRESRTDGSRAACIWKNTRTSRDRFGSSCLTLPGCKVTLALVISQSQHENRQG